MMNNNGTTPLSPELTVATENLAEALWAAAPLAAYREAQSRFQAEPAAQALLESLGTRQNELRLKQMNGGMTQEDIDAVRALQSAVQSNAIIMDYIQAQQDALSYLPQVNQAISQWLGVDFAALASGG
jgi:cell fate (sporulation/competence/biofilm development) regulator YlbF (YheA/YmcA/DUF963 family)